ncbi:MAG: hypothetical protein ACBZ72_06005 [Candidatus Bathyarchaeia archaeon]
MVPQKEQCKWQAFTVHFNCPLSSHQQGLFYMPLLTVQSKCLTEG